jgi:hypothetical protein
VVTAERNYSALASLQRALAGANVDDDGADADAPFLSVVIRTMGDRRESLRDALLCLAGQHDEDFEVILMVHNPASSAVVDSVRTLVTEEVGDLAARVRVEVAVGVGRSRPLNAALTMVRGRYVAFYDDDDVVLANWVRTFHEASAVAWGRVLRAIVVDQHCVFEPWVDGDGGYVADGELEPIYRERFSLLEHVMGRSAPLHSFAFPRSAFTSLGLKFDEAISVLEDWDFELRAIRFLGVHSVEVVTGVYRRHPDSDSLALHPPSERDAVVADKLREIVADDVFLIDGEELMDFRSTSQLLAQRWRERDEAIIERDQLILDNDELFAQKEREAADKEALALELAQLEEPRALARQWAAVVRNRLRRPRSQSADVP